MADLDFIRKLVVPATSKIVLLVIDGVGGLPMKEGGLTELETARTPNLDALAARSICGLSEPISPGITPGSGPAHLALFGYDPIRYQIGRGVLEALGIGFDLQPSDLAARGNFCTVDAKGLVTDRRAGRISTEKCIELSNLLSEIELPGVEVLVEPVKEHRFLLVLRGDGLSDELTESDPKRLGVPPLPIEPKPEASNDPAAQRTAQLVSEFVAQARAILADHHPANMLLLRGFAKLPKWPTMEEAYGLKAAAIATYPMYRGVAKLVGMEALDTGETIAEEFECLAENYDRYDFFFLHIKKTDSAGEDGDFDRKVALIEEVDRNIPSLLGLEPEVIIVTGDHSTPALLRSHSWHPVPLLLYSRYCRPDAVKEFSERACATGALGRFPAVEIMPLALANAGRLVRFGA